MAKKCTACGTVLTDEKKFCTECGSNTFAAVAEPVAPPPPPPQPRAQPRAKVACDDDAPAPGSRYEPITMGGYIGIMLLMCIPLVGVVLALIWAFGGCKKINKRNFARAMLVFMAITLVLSLLLGMVGRSLFNKVMAEVEQQTGVTVSGDQNNGGGNGLLGLIGSLSGGSNEDVTNPDIESLEDLEGLLGLLGGDGTSGLEEFIGDAADVNREAEAANDGWPKSLRKYPGGTANATASYRTEITGTTQEEYLGWIDDLRGDGFRYQDFYDFGMSEDDMLSMNGWWATDGDIYISLSYSEGTVIVDHMTELPDMSSLLG